MMPKSVEVAYIVRDEARGHYTANDNSPTRIIPPYGTEVEVVRIDPEWALIKVFGKEAWVKAEYLGESPPPERTRFQPTFGVSYAVIPGTTPASSSQVEYGPRGGRFTRTKNGYRRYF